VMTKYIGMEGTEIIANDYAGELEGVLDGNDMEQVDSIHKSLSVVAEGIRAAGIEGVSAMHDITEGGILGALSEMCEASGVGAEIRLADVPVLDVTKKICAHYGLDVFSLISSGSMLITAENGKKVVDELAADGIKATVVGKVTAQKGLVDAGSGRTLVPVVSDELYKVIEKQR